MIVPSSWFVRSALAAAVACASAAMAQDTPPPKTAQRVAPRIVNVEECKPAYPAESTKAGETGTTRLLLRVDASGQLVDAKVARSSGFARLDQATMDALTRCRYSVGTVDGTPTEMAFTLNFNWRLEDPPKLNTSACMKVEDYPAESVRLEEQGTVVLRVWLSALGEVDRAEVDRSSGFERLDRAAMRAVSRCKLKVAGDADGKGPRGPVRIEYVWRLEDGLPSGPAFSNGPTVPDPYRPF
jgi:TonB family protein